MTRPLVLVHGFMGGRAQWGLQTDALGLKRKVISIALPGFGDRAGETAVRSIEGFARSVIADLDAQDITHFDLLGHSMGGMIVQDINRLVPSRVSRLILYGTGAVGSLPGRFETIQQSKARAREEGLPNTARRIAATWFLHRDAAYEYENCAKIAEQTNPTAFDTGLDAMQNWSGEPHLIAITAPTLVLWGDGDRTYPWSQTETLWRKIKNAKLAVIPGCAHAVHLEKPQLFNQIVQDFLETAEVR